MKAELEELIEPTVVNLGYELSDLELKLGGRDGIVRVFIDKPEGVDLTDCEIVSKQLSAVLDVEDPLPGHYTLEVSSPGLDRKLTKPSHFQRFLGETVRVKLRFPLAGDKIEVEVDGEKYSLEIAAIESARLVPSY
jgi:ribosome maturation factor RimP